MDLQAVEQYKIMEDFSRSFRSELWPEVSSFIIFHLLMCKQSVISLCNI